MGEGCQWSLCISVSGEGLSDHSGLMLRLCGECRILKMCVLSSTAMVMPQPMVPAVDPSQLAAQQQAFINQQAMLMVSGRAPGSGEEPHTGVCALEGSPALLLFGPAPCHSVLTCWGGLYKVGII